MKPPFSWLFDSESEAHRILDSFRESLERLAEPGDPRLAFTLPGRPRAVDARLAMSFVKWKILAYRRINSRTSFKVLLPVNDPCTPGLNNTKEYVTTAGGLECGTYVVPAADFLAPGSTVRQAHLEFLPTVQREFEGTIKTSIKTKNHELEQLICNLESRAHILRDGLRFIDG